jgi:hypothetical protein
VKATSAAKLTDPFEHIMELGDNSISYRVAGFLSEVTHILSGRSKLRSKMLTTIHNAGIEIISPIVMNQRRLEEGVRVLPPRSTTPAMLEDPAMENNPESLIFDKADAVAQIEALKDQPEAIREEIVGLKAQIKSKGKTIGPWIERRITQIQQEEERLSSVIQKAEEEKIE